jgi:hypothetical protein
LFVDDEVEVDGNERLAIVGVDSAEDVTEARGVLELG